MYNIRNFSIIAHINHGKSTLSDRLIQICNGLSSREMSEQVLDSMDIERERGITIKAQCVTLFYKNTITSENYQLNFIDTPGHVDFSYEVSRSLSACEGALLLIDGIQGIEAQTVANYNFALKRGLKIIPVINKIDLDIVDLVKIKKEIKDILNIKYIKILEVSAKFGIGISNLLDSVTEIIPSPTGRLNDSLQAIVIDSWFDHYLGVVSLLRIKNGFICVGDKISVVSTGKSYIVNKIGIFTPKEILKKSLLIGEVGFIVTGVKDINMIPVGDTITSFYYGSEFSLSGFRKVNPNVYFSVYPLKSCDYEKLSVSLSKLKLNDSALFYEQEFSNSLGFGFRCGVLGLLHMEIVKERIEREYDVNVITTIPMVVFEVITKNGKIIYIDNPSNLPVVSNLLEIREPIIKANIIFPKKYLGDVVTLCVEKRGIQKKIDYIGDQIFLTYDLPMNEIIVDFFDKLKSVSRGFASFDYSFDRFSRSDLVKLDILLNKNKVDSLSFMVHRSCLYNKSREIVDKIKILIKKHMFEINIQAVVGNKVIASNSIKAYRKNVTSKCYGGDITRKRKLLEKQKKGKSKMKSFGNVFVSSDIFLNLFSLNGKNK